MKYFTGCTTLEALKKEYRRLAMANHPDRGGDEATMKAINAEYDAVFPAFRLAYNRTAEAPTTETAQSYESGRSLKEIAQLVRQFIKEQFPTYKFSVRTSYASMCQELHVDLKEAPCKIYKDFAELTAEEKHTVIRKASRNSVFSLNSWTDAELKAEFDRIWNTCGSFYRVLSEQIQAAVEAVDGYVKSFCFEDCDAMIDYFHVNFYYFGCGTGNVQFVPKAARIANPKEPKPEEKKADFLRVVFVPEFDGVEVYFPGKPAEATRTALKAAGYRWHGKKRCWYAKNTEQHLQALRAIETGLTV
mgnify:CR=1 FL=1